MNTENQPAPEDAAADEPAAAAAAPRPRGLLHWPGWGKVAAIATTVGTLGAAFAAVAALWFTGQSLRATNNQYGLAQQTAVTDRFRLAAEQLASDKINVRLSGIYLLERLAKDSPPDHPTVFALLAGFLRTQNTPFHCSTTDWLRTPVDVQAALTAIGHRNVVNDNPGPDIDSFGSPDLRGVCLKYAHASGGQFPGADFGQANLEVAVLERANLAGANLVGTVMTEDILTGADLSGARLAFADLTGSDLSGANLSGADLTRAKLSGVAYNEGTRWPAGFTPPPPMPPTVFIPPSVFNLPPR